MAPEETPSTKQAKTYEDYFREAWLRHATKDEDAAEENFRKAIALNPQSADAYYGLGLVLKAQDRRQEAISAFQQVVDSLNPESEENRSRTHILRRLAIGHMNMLRSGDWDLEKEIWKRSE